MVLQTRTQERSFRKLLSVLEGAATCEVWMKKRCEQCGSKLGLAQPASRGGASPRTVACGNANLGPLSEIAVLLRGRRCYRRGTSAGRWGDDRTGFDSHFRPPIAPSWNKYSN